MTLSLRALNGAYRTAATPAALALRLALRDPRAAQVRILRRIVASNRECGFGRAHGFSSIKGYSDYAKHVPVTDYEDIGNEIDRIRQGHPDVLTSEAVAFLEPTGGSSGPSKLIPYTSSLKRQMARAANPWIRNLLARRPELRDGRAFWAVSPPIRSSDHRSGGRVRIGASHDLDYLPTPVAALMERVLVLPRAVSEIEDLDACRYVTLRSLLVADDLAFISVWNPSFLTLLMDELDDRFEMLLRDLERGQISIPLDASVRERLEDALPARPDVTAGLRRRFGSRPPLNLGDLWDGLRLISCWTDGHARRSLVGMRCRFPEVEVQGKGLMATEGIVSVPLLEHLAPVAAVTSHFLEFIPEMGGPARLVDELDEGHIYEVVLTTGGGLYRYRLKDLVRVEGHVQRTPMLHFVGRADGASDLCGEKLTPAFVERAIQAASTDSGIRPRFAVLAPRWGEPPCYDLWVELAVAGHEADDHAARLAAEVDVQLRHSHHYNLCRALGQLDPIRARLIRDAERTYERACGLRGQRVGAVKPPALVADLAWSDLFEEVAS